jgi:hypothetical protein
MNFRLCTGLAAIVSMTLVSCYPYPPNHPKKRAGKSQEKPPTAEQMKLKQEEEAKKKAAEEEMKMKEAAERGMTEDPGTVTPPSEGPKPVEPKSNDYPFANKVPGKEGFVFSPFNNKVVDVRDIPSGTLVQDPTYPASEKKYFRVP